MNKDSDKEKQTAEEETWKRIWRGEGKPPTKDIREFIVTREGPRKGNISIKEKF